MSGASTPKIGVSQSPGNDVAWGSSRERVAPTYASDPKYKKYIQQVDKCLNSFDSVHEWADFISFLKQLLKTFQSYMQFKEIPRKLVVSKRLSQCLNPALPTGVHQRALDVYAHILAVLGSEGLQRDLALWSSGLFPFFEYAATSVKPVLLNLFDTHYLPLQLGLRPIMKSFILALLPGLEEETGEYFDKVLVLLDKLSGTVSPSFFLQNIWLVLLTTPSSRGTALNFLSRRLPKLNADEDISSIVGRDIGLMIRAFAAALEDDDSLVRRGALELLLQSLRMDSIAVTKAQAEDRAILMRAASSVVLRRDLALNRRLYAWLLGSDENSERQISYFKTHALELLRSTLRNEMFNPDAEYSQSRPFKIFISLLDKWEIGSPLTDVLVFDAFQAIRKAIDNGSDSGGDMAMTASTLYEAIEPQVLWKQLLAAILADITGDTAKCERISMVMYLLTTFHTHDEEMENVHYPIVFSATLEVLVNWVQLDAAKIHARRVRETLLLLHELLSHIPRGTLVARPETDGQMTGDAAYDGPYVFACAVYDLGKEVHCRTRRCPNIPLVTVFEDLVELNILCAAAPQNDADADATREVLHQSLILLSSLVDRLQQSGGIPTAVTWDPKEWLRVMLRCMDQKTVAFTTVDNIATTAIKLQQTNSLDPKLVISDGLTIDIFINTLLGYLRQPWAAYHMRAVSLIWTLWKVTKASQVESIISQSLSSRRVQDIQVACEVFGVLWRLTDDSLQPGFRLKTPMMIVLDALKSEDPGLRRVGETWMRCSLKSYIRLLDPLIHDLLDPSIRLSPCVTEINGKQLQGYTYERPFDQRYINYLLETLLSVIKFGGQGFSKIARSTPVGRSSHSGFVRRLQSANAAFTNASYLDVMLHILLKFLQSEPKSTLAPFMHPLNVSLHSSSIDLLQAFVARGEVDSPTLQTIESAVIRTLYVFVHTGRLDLQNKLLHLLHSIISASGSSPEARSNRLSKNIQPPEVSQSLDSQSSTVDSYSINPLLVQTLVDGISIPSNRPILQHWLDFILMTVPQFHETLQFVLIPLNESVCRQLRSALTDVLHASSHNQHSGDIVSFTTDADFVMLLNTIERLALLSISEASDAAQAEEESPLIEKANPETTGLFGYVSNVFGSDYTSGGPDESGSTKSSDYRCLRETIEVLYLIWDNLMSPDRQHWTSQEESLSLIVGRTRTRCRRVLEHLFRANSTEVLETIIDCWHNSLSDSSLRNDSAAFELVDVLTSSAQTVVHMTCESISSRTPGLSERTKKQAFNANLTDMILFEFLEQYLTRLEGPLATQVWSRFLQLAKDLAATLREFKVQAFPALRCFTVLAEKVTQTTAMDDRRLRKELQETYSKLLDTCVLAGRPYDQGTWIRRGPRDTLGVNGRDSPVPRDTKLDVRMNASSTSLPDSTVKPPWNVDMSDQINIFIASGVLPNLRRFLMESDKILAACNNIVYNIVNPALKGKSKPLDAEDTAISILREMTKLAAALRAWRGPITEVLNDNRCFNSTPNAGRKWMPMIKMLFDADKAALPELLGKITTAPSSNIFTNREYEMLLRSLNLRRLSYVILAGEKNHFLTHLPAIQEKLVDTLRNVSAPIVQSEVYLCVRVLLCRLSPHNLSSFWPVILTELYRLFEQAILSLPPDGSEELVLVLSACKLLDLLLVLQTEEFQIHQWMFITDTVDAIYRPDDWDPLAMLDRLAELSGALSGAQNGHPSTSAEGNVVTPTIDTRVMRRPMLQSLRQIESIRDLVPFLSHVSIASYESVYHSGGNVDWEAVEKALLEDMFDGR